MRIKINNKYIEVEKIKSPSEINVSRQNMVFEAPAGSGKTYIATAIICAIQQKTIIVANQANYLKNFIESFENSTNLLQLREQTGKPIVKLINNQNELLDPDIDVALITYQMFIADYVTQSGIHVNNKQYIKSHINDHYSLLVADEAHIFQAPAPAKFLDSLNIKHRLGFTATPNTWAKNINNLVNFGPIRIKEEKSGMPVNIEYDFKSFNMNKWNKSMWSKIKTAIWKNESRNRYIAKKTFDAVKEGHTICFIPVETVAQCNNIINYINELAEEKIAYALTGTTQSLKLFNGLSIIPAASEEIIDDDTGQDSLLIIKRYTDSNGNKKVVKKYLRVIVAIYSMIKESISITCASYMLYSLYLSASSEKVANGEIIGAPNIYQLFGRINRPHPYKEILPPKVTYLIDQDLDASYYAAKAVLNNELMLYNKSNPNASIYRYNVTQEQQEYFKSRGFKKPMNTTGLSNSIANLINI